MPWTTSTPLNEQGTNGRASGAALMPVSAGWRWHAARTAAGDRSTTVPGLPSRETRWAVAAEDAPMASTGPGRAGASQSTAVDGNGPVRPVVILAS